MNAEDLPETSGSESDSSLMAQFYGCSEGAFETLAERWHPRLFAFFRKLGFGNEDAEDLALESLVKLYATKERRSFDTSQPLAPFLFAVAHNLGIAAWRKIPRGVTRVPWDESLPLVTGEQEPDSGWVSDLMTCVSELPEAELTYVLLCGRHGLGELSHNEIAAALGKWPPQITQLSKRTLRALKECMTEKGYH